MYPTILILLALAVWVMGYRFYGKFLKLGILQLRDDVATPAVSGARDSEFEPRGRWTVSAFHAAASTGLLSLIGAAIAVVWGWVPAFLWVVLGSVVAATVLSLGTLWATLRRPGESLAGLAYDIGGLPAALALFFAGVLLLVLVGGTLGMVLGSLLHAHPETTWPFLSLAVIGNLLKGDVRKAPLRAGGGIALFIAAFFAGQFFPLTLVGSWTFSIRDVEVFGLRHELIWAVIALYLAYRAAGIRASESTHGRGILASALTVLVLVLFTIGTALQGDAMDAPQFNSAAGLPPTILLLFIVVTGGALSGMHALVASGFTARSLERRQDVMPVGYLGVGLDSLVAVMAVTALATGFSAKDAWQAVYGTWPVHGGLYVWVDLAITKVAMAISALGIPLAWSVGLVAAMCATLALSMLETTLRILSSSVQEFVQDFEFEWVNTPTFKQRCALTLIGITTFILAQTTVDLQDWLLIGIANQWFACSVLVLLGLLLWRARRAAVFCWAPLAVVGPLTVGGTVWIMTHWVQQRQWALLGVGIVICLCALVYLAMCGGAALQLRRQMLEGTSASPPRF